MVRSRGLQRLRAHVGRLKSVRRAAGRVCKGPLVQEEPKRNWKIPRVLRELERLPEDEKRKRLLELLRKDVCGEACNDTDGRWQMPHLGEDGRTADAGPSMTFDFRESEVRLGQPDRDAWQQLAKACRLVFALDGSSWMPCGARPTCLAERVAAEIFAHHTQGAIFDKSSSGAEWWAQVRQGGHPEEAVRFHWDTDEEAVEGHGVNVHPHLSTVTYLTACGAPTLVVDRRNPPRPEDSSRACGDIHAGLWSEPRTGKHVSFDGQLLHGTVPRHHEGGERLTFLVNVWLNHRPSHSRRVPRSLARRLGDAETSVHLSPGVAPHFQFVKVAGARYELFETSFGRREPEYCLRLPLPISKGTKKEFGRTWLLKWPVGSAELRKL